MNREEVARSGEGVINKPGCEAKVRIVNTGINRYIEFEEHLQGFKDGEILTYHKCQDGTSVIVKGRL